jgi:hypothetical protein
MASRDGEERVNAHPQAEPNGDATAKEDFFALPPSKRIGRYDQ